MLFSQKTFTFASNIEKKQKSNKLKKLIRKSVFKSTNSFNGLYQT